MEPSSSKKRNIQQSCLGVEASLVRLSNRTVLVIWGVWQLLRNVAAGVVRFHRLRASDSSRNWGHSPVSIMQ